MKSTLMIQIRGKKIGMVKELIGFTEKWVVMKTEERPKEVLLNLSINVILDGGKNLSELNENDYITFINAQNEVIGSSDDPHHEEVAKKLHEVLQ